MKKIVIFLFAICALCTFSCNKYCDCKHYIDGEIDKDYTNGRFVKELKECKDYNDPLKEIEGHTYELKCK